MAARPLQPSEYEIQREVEALKDLRRRSSTPGALALDPDLPNQSPPASPTSQYWAAKSPSLSLSLVDNGSTASGESSDGANAAGTGGADGPNNPADDPFHLFWVPASLHPEIAPAEFRAFLKEHARAPNSSEDFVPSDRSSTASSLAPSASLNRKRSMLSRQYKPKENDGVEDENVVPLKRNRSILYPTNQGPHLTINDLQKLEELAEEASESDDPSKFRSVLRRSLSLNLSPTAIEQMDEMPEMGDEADVPIIVPPPGQILRRAARTKIRKPGLPGDGGGHRFGASRRGAKTSQAPAEPRTSSEMSSSDHGDGEPSAMALRRQTLSDEGQPRPESYSEETSIYDAYARDDDDEPSYAPILETPHPEEPSILHTEEPPQIPPVFETPQPDLSSPILHQPQPQRLAVPQHVPDQAPPSRTPSPSEPVIDRPTPVQTPSYVPTPPSMQARKEKEKEKDKKGLFGKWGGDKGGKKANKDKERESRERASAEKEKDSGFFGSLFGKKKQDADYQSSITGGTSGREAAHALLGASKSSKSYVPPTSPGLAPGIGGNPYARYPIHVERAIYRLSHIKLANPRRPLYEQVLISNLMFWYLGVINKAQTPTASPPQLGASGTPATGNGAGENKDEAEKEEQEREQREKEQREKAEAERLERERLEKEQREREMENKKKESGRRGSLTKTPAGGQPGGGRRAEMAVKGPQYEMQHRVMEQEYGGYNGQPPRSPTTGRPPVNGAAGQSFQRSQKSYDGGPKLVQPQPKPQAEQYYYQPQTENNAQQQQRPGLPPGAMAPVDQGGWGSQPNPPPQHRRSQSPPSRNQLPHKGQPNQMLKHNASQESLGDHRNGGHRSPARSLSASASPPMVQPNGNLRKGNSAHAVSSYDRRPHTGEGPGANGEEEDVPLAVWQQQRRK